MKREDYAYSPSVYEDMDGTVIKDGRVVAMPYCPSGKCWMTKNGKRMRVRLKRHWLKDWGHWELRCHRCGSTPMRWY